MAIAIAFVVVLMLTILASAFVMFALTIRRDFHARFARVAEQLEQDALLLVRHVMDREGTTSLDPADGEYRNP